jgi:hypothetical protein
VTATVPLAEESPAARWFGAHFEQLHPLLQRLHCHGGTLAGEVTIRAGMGIAAWFGRRLARSLGIPAGQERCGFEVEIGHAGNTLLWQRRFESGARMLSVFEPVGTWPDGYWVERTGPFALRLTVDVIDQGWHWRVLGASYRGVPIPRWALPVSRAWKRIEDGRYRFKVEFAMPMLGTVLAYGGMLDVVGSQCDVGE